MSESRGSAIFSQHGIMWLLQLPRKLHMERKEENGEPPKCREEIKNQGQVGALYNFLS